MALKSSVFKKQVACLYHYWDCIDAHEHTCWLCIWIIANSARVMDDSTPHLRPIFSGCLFFYYSKSSHRAASSQFPHLGQINRRRRFTVFSILKKICPCMLLSRSSLRLEQLNKRRRLCHSSAGSFLRNLLFRSGN